jgi:hypothetical protein
MNVARQRMRLFVTGTGKTLSYVLQDGDARPSSDSVRRPGATLVLQQAQPTDIVVTNLARQATAVHWHGLELDSYYDGVVGWSGVGTTVAPIIAPGDSFVARITPPRAGTFIYHTHVDELTQLPAGYSARSSCCPKARRNATQPNVCFFSPTTDSNADRKPAARAGDPIRRRSFFVQARHIACASSASAPKRRIVCDC